MKVNIRKAREKFSEIINRVAIKGERVVVSFKNRPKAAIVSLEDLERLETSSIKKAKRIAQIKKIRRIRDIIHKKGIVSDSTDTLRKIREDRIEGLSSRN